MAKVKIRREQVKKGILTELEVPGVIFDGMEPDDVSVFFIKQVSHAYADTVGERLKDIKPENFLALVNEVIVETLVDDEGNSVFDAVTEIPYSFTLAAWRPFLKKAFDLEFITGQKDANGESGDKVEAEGDEVKASDTAYGPNGTDSSPAGDLSVNPFTPIPEGDSSTG